MATLVELIITNTKSSETIILKCNKENEVDSIIEVISFLQNRYGTRLNFVFNEIKDVFNQLEPLVKNVTKEP